MRRALIFFAGATGMAFFSASLIFPGIIQTKGYLLPLQWQLMWWYSWLPMIPPILWLSRRFSITGQNWWHRIPLHLGASIILALAHLQLCVLVSYALHSALWSDLILYKTDTPEIVMLRYLTSPATVHYEMRILLYVAILISSHAYSYYNRSLEDQIEALRLRSQLSIARIQALRMQLHPHFLFNALHSVSALLDCDIDAAEQMVKRLIAFLHLTLESPQEWEVTLAKELDFLETYLSIEQIRFQDRLIVKMDVEPATLTLRVPQLILQPIIENAIRHGIAPKPEGGTIEISARQENGILKIQVRDNGVGIEHAINEGFGLSNTRLRLQQLYGTSQRFELLNSRNGGLTVLLQIPSHFQEALQ